MGAASITPLFFPCRELIGQGRGGTTPRGAKAHADFAISRSLNFCTLPVLVFGISENTT